MAAVFTNAVFCSSVQQKCFSVDGTILQCTLSPQLDTILQCMYTSTQPHQPFIFSNKTYHSLSYVCPHLTLYNKYSTTTVLSSLLLYQHSLQYCLYVRVIVRFQTSILYSIVFYANNCRVSSQHSYAVRLYMRVFIVFQTKVQRCTYCDFPRGELIINATEADFNHLELSSALGLFIAE